MSSAHMLQGLLFPVGYIIEDHHKTESEYTMSKSQMLGKFGKDGLALFFLALLCYVSSRQAHASSNCVQ